MFIILLIVILLLSFYICSELHKEKIRKETYEDHKEFENYINRLAIQSLWIEGVADNMIKNNNVDFIELKKLYEKEMFSACTIFLKDSSKSKFYTSQGLDMLREGYQRALTKLNEHVACQKKDSIHGE